MALMASLGCASEVAPTSNPDVGAPTEARPRCLGSADLCERSYAEVSYFTSHNAMSNEAEGWFVPNHLVPVEAQLELGVRALMLDVLSSDGALMLCHGTCLAGSEPLDTRLATLRSFLESHPGEILTLILESYAPAAEVAAIFEAEGLSALAHTQVPGEPWPRLEELIEADRRLVVFTDAADGGPDWMHDVWAHAFETHFSVTFAEDFTCEPNRGDPAHALFILNHFLSTPFADLNAASEVNAPDFVLERALSCWEAHDTRPNFITVDFVAQGDVMSAVDDVNQRSSPTDRSAHRARRR